LLAASLVFAAIDAGALGFEVRFDVARFGVARFGVCDETLLVAMLLAVLSVRLLATANPVSGATAEAAAVVASEERAWIGAVSTVAEPDVGDGSAAEVLRRVELTALGFIGAELTGAESTDAGSTGAELTGAELLTLESPDWGVAGCLAVAGSVRGARLFSLPGDCSVGIGGGVGVNAGIGAEDAGETMLEAGLVEGAGPRSRADKATGWSEELLRTDDGSAFVSGGAGGNEAAGTDGDRTIGDWSSAKIVAPAGIGA
jgi:hypothetical protein